MSPDDPGVETAQDVCDEIGPDTVPEILDLPDGGGLIPDETTTAFGSYAPYDPCEGFGE